MKRSRAEIIRQELLKSYRKGNPNRLLLRKKRRKSEIRLNLLGFNTSNIV